MRAPSLDEKGSFFGPPWEELYRRRVVANGHAGNVSLKGERGIPVRAIGGRWGWKVESKSGFRSVG